MTVEAVRHRVGATVVKTPFFNPREDARPAEMGIRGCTSFTRPSAPPRDPLSAVTARCSRLLSCVPVVWWLR